MAGGIVPGCDRETDLVVELGRRRYVAFLLDVESHAGRPDQDAATIRTDLPGDNWLCVLRSHPIPSGGSGDRFLIDKGGFIFCCWRRTSGSLLHDIYSYDLILGVNIAQNLGRAVLVLKDLDCQSVQGCSLLSISLFARLVPAFDVGPEDAVWIRPDSSRRTIKDPSHNEFWKPSLGLSSAVMPARCNREALLR